VSTGGIDLKTAIRDFREARQRAALQEVIGRLTGRSTQLLSYEEVAQKLKLSVRADRGIRSIPIRSIVGSVGRYTDFTRTFLPLQQEDEQRWARVKTAVSTVSFPPIEVYKVGEVYFVLDGNHRVSIARQEGMESIDAYVTEVQTPVPLTPDIQPDDLIVKAEYAEFLAKTHLAELRPNVKIMLTAPGQYQKLLDNIEIECLSREGETCGCNSYEDAAVCWYDEEYLPLVDAIREQGLMRWFPNRAEADLALWVLEHRIDLEKELGWEISPDAAVSDLAVEKSSRAGSREKRTGSWRKTRMDDRYIDHLFKDILVPLNGEDDCWGALRQAIRVAAREDAHIHGLHVVHAEKEKKSVKAKEIREQFAELCTESAVTWDFHIDSGEIADRIMERARLTDLLVLNIAHPPEAGLAGLRSGLRSIIMKCTRPILAIGCDVSALDRALLAFDDSPKSKEALFVAAYLAEQWMTSLTVVTITDIKSVPPATLDFARAYLDLHEIQAEYLTKNGPLESLHEMMDDLNINLLLMGGYSRSALEQVMVSSMVDLMLRINHSPIFICR
jgi:nucleotide-binding universal stress UspA family protein